MRKISVIIPTYNRARTLRTTIESFIAQEYPKSDFEIIVCDNASTDETKAVTHSLTIDSPVRIRYLYEPRAGVHYARNNAARAATYDLLYFTDDDMVADKVMLREIIRPFDFDEEVCAASGSVLPNWEIPPPRWVLKYCQNSILSLFTPTVEFAISTEVTKNYGYIFSCHEAIRREALIRAGGFFPENTEGRWVGAGEVGTNHNLQALGCKFGYVRSAITYHSIPAARMTQAYLNKRYANEARCWASMENRRDPSPWGVSTRAIVRNGWTLPLRLLRISLSMVRRVDPSLARIMQATLSQAWARNGADVEFLLSKTYRDLVLKDSYWEE